jgi:L-threonylcarbamoyladenylate synthase
VDLILDGGATPGGLESTVLDVSVTPLRLLRPGLIAPAEMERVVGPIQRSREGMTESIPLRSPGMLGRHYAPRTPLEIASNNGRARVAELRGQGKCVGWLTFDAVPDTDDAGIVMRVLPCDATACAAGLYAALHLLDDAGVDCIVVAAPPATEEWLAIHDRLRRAAAPAD